MTEHHAKYSPSQLSRIIACPGSVQLSEPKPNDSSSYAEEGTFLHSVMEQSLRKSDSDNVKIDQTRPLTKEQLRACEHAADYFMDVYREVALQPGGAMVDLEVQSSLAYLGQPDCYGTADVRIVSLGRLDIIDWKFGQGIHVDVQHNPQLKAYALGAFGSKPHLLSCSTVRTHVVQPRLDNCWYTEYTSGELLDWFHEVLVPAFNLATMPQPQCFPGEDQCRWCKAKMDCRARYEYASKAATHVFSTFATQTVDAVRPEELAVLLKDAKVLEQYIKDIKQFALNQCIEGVGFPGHKAVLGRTSRHWKDEREALRFLLTKTDEGEFEFDELYVSKFVTPPQAEKLTKLMKKDPEFQDLYRTVPGKPTLVPETDPREEYAMNATSAFSNYVEK